MKNATLKLCVTTILALTIALMIGPTVCHAEEQITAAVEVSSIEQITIDKSAAMWSIPEDQRTNENFGPGILLNQVASDSEATPVTFVEESVEVTEVIKEEQPVIHKEEPVSIPVEESKEEVKQDIPVQPRRDTANRWGISLSEKEKNILARILKLESGGESNLGQQAVVEVILNRVVDKSFPNTVIGVLSARGQFTTWPHVNSKSATPTAKEYANIDTVLSGNTNIFPFKTVYFSRGAQNPRVQARIGDHTFCNKK